MDRLLRHFWPLITTIAVQGLILTVTTPKPGMGVWQIVSFCSVDALTGFVCGLTYLRTRP